MNQLGKQTNNQPVKWTNNQFNQAKFVLSYLSHHAADISSIGWQQHSVASFC